MSESFIFEEGMLVLLFSEAQVQICEPVDLCTATTDRRGLYSTPVHFELVDSTKVDSGGACVVPKPSSNRQLAEKIYGVVGVFSATTWIGPIMLRASRLQ